MPITTGYKELIEKARSKITTLSLEQARAKLGLPHIIFVDIRDRRELEREGKIPGAFHAPRGMLEFWVDPESPYFKPIFSEQDQDGIKKEFILYCQSAWRSSLAATTLKDMGMENISHIEGGIKAWKEAHFPLEEVPAPTK
jgi:rhodanese-related sulfurtransferase